MKREITCNNGTFYTEDSVYPLRILIKYKKLKGGE